VENFFFRLDVLQPANSVHSVVDSERPHAERLSQPPTDQVTVAALQLFPGVATTTHILAAPPCGLAYLTATTTPMKRFLTLMAWLLMLSLSQVDDLHAQTEIRADQNIRGRLETTNPKLPDGSFYDLYLYRGRPGERIRVTMRSSDFDAYLSGGSFAGGSLNIADTDDDSDGGTDARMEVTIGADGLYAIRANSLFTGVTGAYTLLVESLAPSSQGGAAPGYIEAGQTVQGRLHSGSRVRSDDSYYDLYLYQGSPGERIVIRMRSSSFDTYLSWGPWDGRQVSVEANDDDGDGGTDSRLEVTIGSTGVYGIMANTLSSSQTGSYTLSLERAAAPGTSTQSVSTIRPGMTVQSRLQSGSRLRSDGSYYDLYTFEGSAGDRVIITMRSTEFDAYLSFGPYEGGDVTIEQSDDDSGGGTDSRIEATLARAGTYGIMANSLGSGETGAYSLTLERGASGQGANPRAARTVSAGESVSGHLEPGSRVRDDGSYYDLYTYQGNVGERIVITMRSSAFDTFLSFGPLEAGEVSVEQSNDDGADGTNSRLEVTLSRTGLFGIMANSLGAGETGPYTLSVERLPAGSSR
jgi:hypothetical protein